MASARTWSGWIGFAALMLLILAAIQFLMGLVAVIRGEYYLIHGEQLIIFDTTAWGWITMLIAVALACVGLGLASGADWARWATILLVSVNLVQHLAWLGNSAYPLWSLAVLALQIIVLFALTARWNIAAQATP